MPDHCESAVALAFAPLMMFDGYEYCSAGEPHWAAKSFGVNTIVRIAYMPSYYDDCGYRFNPQGWREDAHRGNSEMITVEVNFNFTTQHWVLRRMWTSAHYGVTNGGDGSRWSDYGQLEYPVRSIPESQPTEVVVRIRKHRTTGVAVEVIPLK